jgi:diketogulonate reductase-like aldo/keto reductase
VAEAYAALAASLHRLGQPRVELYQIHFPLPVTEVAELSALGGR